MSDKKKAGALEALAAMMAQMEMQRASQNSKWAPKWATNENMDPTDVPTVWTAPGTKG